MDAYWGSFREGRLSGGLFDDLRTVTPGFGLSLGQGQPGGLCGHLRRVAGWEALRHVLDSRWGRGRVGDLNWNDRNMRQA